MKTGVVSLMWGNAWGRYGWIFAESFRKHWPASTQLYVVTDNWLPIEGYQIPLNDVAGYADFRDRHRDNPLAHGKNRVGKLDENGVSWRHDAMKWMPQALAPNAVLRYFDDGDIMAWFDADTYTTKAVPENWIETLLDGHDVACLQRDRQHSEIGFYAIRVHAKTRLMLRTFAAYYMTDGVFSLPEWHSAYVWDRALEKVGDLRVRNLSPNNRGHVWPATALAEYTVHNKGKRKG